MFGKVNRVNVTRRIPSRYIKRQVIHQFQNIKKKKKT